MDDRYLNHESHFQNSLLYLSHIICTSPHEGGEYFILFLDLLGSDAVLTVEDGDVTKFALHL